MKEIIASRESIIFVVLTTLTLASWLLGTHQASLYSGIHTEGSVILLLAFIKVRMVINNFMEVRHAPVALKACCNAWVFILATIMIVLYNNWITVT